MQLAAPVQSVGFPTNYPYAQSMPLPSAILRPLQQPLYDTENLPTAAITEMIYFQRQLGQTFAQAPLTTKTVAETNLQQPGQLANPLEFSLFGFLYEVQPGTGFLDFGYVYTTSVFIFTYTGNRTYLQVPLMRIPQGVAPEGFAWGYGQTSAVERMNIHNGVGHISNLYKFTIGRAALRIRPTESFQVKISWSVSGGVTMTAVVRTRIYLQGISWTPL